MKVLDILHNFTHKCTFAFGGASVKVGLVEAIPGTVRISGFAVGEYGTVIEIGKFAGFNGKCRFAGMIKEK
ncbi:MAG: hypothetical protein ABSB78_13875 [Bacteroidota bacterium]